MAAVKQILKSFPLRGFRLLPLACLLFLICGCGITPYESKFSCPPTYQGLCESPIDAYRDSVNGIDPRQLDPEWKEKRAKWEEKNKALIEARKQAEIRRAGTSSEAPTYRAELFKELRDLIEAPETPVVIPPKIVRALVLGTPDGKMYVAPHYVFFMLDEPHWVLRKIPERPLRVSSTVSTPKKSNGKAREVRINAKQRREKNPAH